MPYRRLSMLIKPASSLCDMRCAYCFYADVSDLRQIKSYGIMTPDTAQALLRRAFEAAGERGEITFAFQGGEPTLAGLPFFKDFTAAARRLCPPSVSLHYAMQTNGLHLDEDWCALLREHRFLVGLSFDGTAALHDAQRPDASGAGTSRRVLQAARLLREQGIETNILCVVTEQAARHPQQIWNFCRRQGFDFLQFIPCLASLDEAAASPHALTPRRYAAFLKGLFPLWRQALTTPSPVSIRVFDNLLSLLSGRPPEQCGMLGRCSCQFVLEADGSVYPCDFYVLDDTRLGRVQESSLEALAASPAAQDFMQPRALPALCTDCPVWQLCFGGCRRTREMFFSQPDYCPWRDFLTETLPAWQELAHALRLR
ncbi:MAG: SPASM domain-containing protein [Eubacteriales bacterium]|nr:SPASM domain-containing protein [Eubacteriales bacterium]